MVLPKDRLFGSRGKRRTAVEALSKDLSGSRGKRRTAVEALSKDLSGSRGKRRNVRWSSPRISFDEHAGRLSMELDALERRPDPDPRSTSGS